MERLIVLTSHSLLGNTGAKTGKSTIIYQTV